MSPLALLFVLSFLVSVDIRILAPVLPSISNSLGSSPGTIGLAMTSYSLAYGTGQLFYGPLSDRLGRIAVVRAAGVGFSICAILSALTVTTWQFILVRLLAGALAGAVLPLTLVFIGDTIEYERRQLVLGRYAATNFAAMAFAASIGGAVSHFISWRLMLIGNATLALIPLVFLWRLDTRAGNETAACVDRYIDLLRNRRALFLYVTVFLQGFLVWGGITYFGAFGIQRYHLNQFTVGLLIALFGIGIMTGGLMMGRIRSRYSENTLAIAGGLLMGLSYLAFIPHWPISVFARGLVGDGPRICLPAHDLAAPGHGDQCDVTRQGVFPVCVQSLRRDVDRQRRLRVAGGCGIVRSDVRDRGRRPDRRRLGHGTCTAGAGILTVPCNRALKSSRSLKSLYPSPLSDSKRFGGGIL